MDFQGFIKQLRRKGLEYFGLYYGKYRGVVVSVDDPQNRGRLTIKCPAVLGDNESDWALPCGMFSGNGIGAWGLPQKGDQVWVEFEGGETDYPIWSYGYHTKNSVADDSKGANYNVVTKSGHQIVIRDEGEEIELTVNGGIPILIKKEIIHIGGNDEPAVLGDKNADALDFLATEIGNIYTILLQFASTQNSAASAATPLAPLIPGYTAITASATPFQTAFNAAKTLKFTNTKSQSVKLK